MSESSIVESIRKLIHSRGGRCIKICPDGRGLKGEPDLICCVDGKFVAIEVKAPGKKPRLLQLRKLELWRQAGAIAFWADSKEDVEESIYGEN